MSEIERKLVRAGAIAHLETGLTIGVHTRLAAGAFDQLACLEEAGLHPSAWIWIHAQAEPDPARLIDAARRGAWISLDGVAPDTVAVHVEKVKRMREDDLLDWVLVSQDAGWYSVGVPRRGFSLIRHDIHHLHSETARSAYAHDNPGGLRTTASRPRRLAP